MNRLPDLIGATRPAVQVLDQVARVVVLRLRRFYNHGMDEELADHTLCCLRAPPLVVTRRAGWQEETKDG
jgi:hypothetical protein